MTDLTISAVSATTAAMPPMDTPLEKPPPSPKQETITAKPASAGPPNPLDEFVMGYPKIAARMGLIPETAMFRRFGALNARNLLYLQNELAQIEEDLKAQEWKDSKSAVGKKKTYALDTYWLRNASPLRDGDVKQRDLVLRMRETLHQYNHALIQQHTILQMHGPDPYDVKNMQCFLYSEQMRHGNVLLGPDMDIWGSVMKKGSQSKELIVLRAREATDSFSRKLSSIAVPLLKKIPCAAYKKPNPDYGAITVRAEQVLKLTFWITSIIASIIPVVSIIVLIKLKDINARLGAIAGFNVLLSACLLVFTDAKRTDVFAVTAAFTAVQVFFVGQALDDIPKEVIISPAAAAMENLCRC